MSVHLLYNEGDCRSLYVISVYIDGEIIEVEI